MSHGPSFLKRFCLASRKRFFLCWLPEDLKEHSDEVIVEQTPQPPKNKVCDVAETISINERTDENIEAQSPASSCGTCFFDPDEEGISVPESSISWCSEDGQKQEGTSAIKAFSLAPKTPDKTERYTNRSHKPAVLTPAQFEPPWMATELGIPPASRRDKLPDPKEPLPDVNLLTLVKDWIGKDLHKLALPTHVSEPLTDLQRRIEAFESSELLDQAALLPAQSVERLLQVSAFVISTYNTVKRNDKPFKNLQNSTFELIYPEKGIRAIGEKVRHIPVTVAVHVEGCGWIYLANDWFYMSLRPPNNALFRPVGEFSVRFHDGDEYVWNSVNTCVHNLIFGKRYCDHGGPFYVTCLGTGDTMRGGIDHSMFWKSTDEVTLSLERQGKKVDGVAMWGFWNREVWAQYPDGAQKCLWRAKPAYVTSSKFLFPEWALHLNELTPELMTKLPPTDDRLRQDMRLMEHGYYLAANNEKERLEAKQRQERDAAEAAGQPWQPRWFEKVSGGLRGFEKYRYKGGYWEARESGNWEGVRTIYGPGPNHGLGPEKPAELIF